MLRKLFVPSSQSRRTHETSERKDRIIKQWKPVSLGKRTLLTTVSISIILIVILQLLLTRSRKDGGLVFGRSIKDLPLNLTFHYLYLPTIISVFYGFLWTWIDLDVRRMEPFFQLAKQGGAGGKESVSLHYTVDFLASVPLKAVRLRHWSVFSASVATALILWGLTPVQSGIFAIETVRQNISASMGISTEYLAPGSERDVLSTASAHSVMDILWLNETLPPFMAPGYMLAPFGPISNGTLIGADETWTGRTQLYSVNITCEPAKLTVESNISFVTSSWGCKYNTPFVRSPGGSADLSSRPYDGRYIGFSDHDGVAQYSLSSSCPTTEPRSFFIQWSRVPFNVSEFDLQAMDRDEVRRRSNVTSRFCRSNYFVQDVVAEVSVPSKSVRRYTPLSPPRPFPEKMLNITDFEAAMNMQQPLSTARTDFPTNTWPSQDCFLKQYPFNIGMISNMVAFAVGATRQPMDNYLEPAVLDASFQAAYRAVFARQMSNILSTRLSSAPSYAGFRQSTPQAIVVVPVFTYISQAFLAAVSLLALWLVWFSGRVSNLSSDPASLSATLSLSAEDKVLLQSFAQMDKLSSKTLKRLIASKNFRISKGKSSEFGYISMDHEDLVSPSSTPDAASSGLDTTLSGVRPKELSNSVGISFLAVQIAAIIFLAVLFFKTKTNNGLPLPSQSRFVRQLLENYLPTAFGGLIEPLWLVLNRHLCVLQPFEALRNGQQTCPDSLDLDYSAYPPQFAFWKALKRKHFLLAAVCLMALLANVLAVAFSGLFIEGIGTISSVSAFSQTFQVRFQPLNGTAPPFTSKDTPAANIRFEPYYVMLTNLTASTPLPPWTDAEYVYFPFVPTLPANAINKTWTYHTATPAIGARLDCIPFPEDSNFHLGLPLTAEQWSGSISLPPGDQFFNITLRDNKGRNVRCVPDPVLFDKYSAHPPYPPVEGVLLSSNELVIGLRTAQNNTSEADQILCRSRFVAVWLRAKPAFSVKNETMPVSAASDDKQSAILCQPRLDFGVADIVTTTDGRVLERKSFKQSNEPIDSLFSSSEFDLFSQVHNYFPVTTIEETPWHNDTNPSSWISFLIEKITNSTSFTNPTKAPPTVDDATKAMSRVYGQLFAVLVARNFDLLLERASGDSGQIAGVIIQQQTRVFMSLALFVIAETVLLLNVAVTVVLYLRRPWRILPRMPTDPASIIAFFAASNAVEDFRGTAGLSEKDRKRHIQELGAKYGFGTFIGTDGKAHLGIEKHPFVAPLTRTKKALTFKSQSDIGTGKKAKWKLFGWQSEKIHEGGQF